MTYNTGDVIKKGFVVDIQSWENDGDDYKNLVTTGLTKAQADFLALIARAFISKNGSRINRSASGFGNDEMHSGVVDFLVETVDSLVDERDSVLERFDLVDYKNMDQDEWLDFLYIYITDSPEQYDCDFCRVVETITIKELPEDFVVPAYKPTFDFISEEKL